MNKKLAMYIIAIALNSIIIILISMFTAYSIRHFGYDLYTIVSIVLTVCLAFSWYYLVEKASDEYLNN